MLVMLHLPDLGVKSSESEVQASLPAVRFSQFQYGNHQSHCTIFLGKRPNCFGFRSRNPVCLEALMHGWELGEMCIGAFFCILSIVVALLYS